MSEEHVQQAHRGHGKPHVVMDFCVHTDHCEATSPVQANHTSLLPESRHTRR